MKRFKIAFSLQKKNNLIEIQHPLFKIIRTALFYALVLLTGTYLIELFNLPLLEKIFHALFVILFAGPSKNFLVITIRYLQSRLAHKTASKIDDIIVTMRSPCEATPLSQCNNDVSLGDQPEGKICHTQWAQVTNDKIIMFMS